MHSRMVHFRTTAAFLVAPLVIPVALSLAAVVFPGDSPLSLTDFFGLVALFSIFALPVAYLCELVLGLPALLLFRRHGIRAWSAFALGGAALGVFYSVTYFAARFVAAKTMGYYFVHHPLTRALDPLSLGLAILAGSASAAVFRAIAFPREPQDKRDSQGGIVDN